MNGKQSEGAEEEMKGLIEIGVRIVFNKQVDSKRERLMDFLLLSVKKAGGN